MNSNLRASAFFMTLACGFASTAKADYALSQNGKPLVCKAENAMVVRVNAARTTLTIESGAAASRVERVSSEVTDYLSFAIYVGQTVSVHLDDEGDFIRVNGTDEDVLNCEVEP